jgi:hypothetical protein
LREHRSGNGSMQGGRRKGDPHGDHQFRLLVHSVKDHAIYTLDPDGVVTKPFAYFG